MPPRDNQRQRLYDAERAAGLAPLAQTIDNADLQKWVDDALDRRPIRSRWGIRSVTIRLGRGQGGAHYSEGSREIMVTREARNPGVLCPELAHSLTSNDVAAHGPEFAGVYLLVVATLLGDEERKRLLAEFRRHRVRHNRAGIPAVRDNVPAPRKKRQREARTAQRERALREVRRILEREVITKADLKRLSS